MKARVNAKPWRPDPEANRAATAAHDAQAKRLGISGLELYRLTGQIGGSLSDSIVGVLLDQARAKAATAPGAFAPLPVASASSVTAEDRAAAVKYGIDPEQYAATRAALFGGVS
jgi:hypothetical protein